MKKLFSLFLTCISVLSAMADDGGTLYPGDWTYGNIYVKKPNSSIALEKEYMYVSGEKIKADFCFRNTTDSTVIVPCAFPVVIRTDFWIYNDSVVIGDEYRTKTDFTFWKIFLDNTNFTYETDNLGFRNRKIPVTEQGIQDYDKKLRVLTYSDYQSKFEITNSDNIYSGCSIIQDGNTVELKNVGIETNVNIREGEGGTSVIELVLHFYHELKFPPNALSKVSVEYATKTLKESFFLDSCEVYYDISTGGTWKGGTIGSFVLLTDYIMQDADTKKEVETLQTTRIIPYNVYSARNYKPKGRFVFGGHSSNTNEVYKRIYLNSDLRYILYTKPDHISLNRNANGDFILNNERSNQFAPFVVDSVINFSVDEPCVGPFVANGFVDVDNSDKNKEMFLYYYYGEEPEMFTMQRDCVWNLYSRIKTSTLTNVDDGWTKTLKFKDLFPAYPYAVASNIIDGWYGSNANYDVALLRPGSYKFEVNDIYKGDSTQTVGLSHIWFYPVDKTLLSMVDEDSESEIPLFSSLWAQLLDIHVTDEKPLLGQADYDKYLEERKEAQENFEKWKREDEERKRMRKEEERKRSHPTQTDEETMLSYVMPIAVGATAAGALLFTAIFILRKRRKNKQKR